MRTRFARLFTVPMLALTLLGGAAVTKAAAQTVVSEQQTTSVDKVNRTVTVTTTTVYSDGTTVTCIETWNFQEERASVGETS